MGERCTAAGRVIDLLRDVLDGVSVVPDTYAPYRPLIADGLVFFFERLPSERLEEIVAEQLALPEQTRDDDRFVAVLRRCPTLHKLGQVVSHERGLTADLRERLQRLVSLPPTVAFPPIAHRIRDELGAAAAHVRVADAALAEGSVAIVVPFAYDVALGAPRTGVFKLLKPDAERRFLEELAVWPDVADYLEERTAHYGLPSLDYRGLLGGIATLLAREVRLDLEQRNIAAASASFGNDPRAFVPRLLPFCTPHLIAMERVDGVKITGTSVAPGVRRRLAEVANLAVARTTILDRGRHGALSTPIRMPAICSRRSTDDWPSSIGRSSPNSPRTIARRVVRVLAGGATLDAALVSRAVAALGYVSDAAALARAVDEALRAVRRGTFPGFDWLTAFLDGLVRAGIVRFPEPTALFRKALLSLSGVVRDVDPKLSIDDVLLSRRRDRVRARRSAAIVRGVRFARVRIASLECRRVAARARVTVAPGPRVVCGVARRTRHIVVGSGSRPGRRTTTRHPVRPGLAKL